MGLLASNMMSKEYGSNHHQCHNTRKKKNTGQQRITAYMEQNPRAETSIEGTFEAVLNELPKA